MRSHVLLALLLAGCAPDFTALDNPAGVVVSCDDAWGATSGADCALDGACEQATPGNPTCCTDYAYCTPSGLVTDTVCSPSCACGDDVECSYGDALCDDNICTPCPDTAACPPCPEGWSPLLRNGCATCQCAPPSECEVPGAACPDRETQCYAGASCAAGCDPSSLGCCGNACAAEGCAGPVPVGCYTDCPEDLGCAICATERCSCDGFGWSCDTVCVDDVVLSCGYTPGGAPCFDDAGCEYGRAICEQSQCEVCPSLAACPDCPEDWVRLLRNGCDSCACGPPSECEAPGELCPDRTVCYAGASCAESCDAFDHGCCSNACAAGGCEGPAPVGCYADCPPELGCEICATDHCTCEGDVWACNTVCIEDVAALIASCVFSG